MGLRAEYTASTFGHPAKFLSIVGRKRSVIPSAAEGPCASQGAGPLHPNLAKKKSAHLSGFGVGDENVDQHGKHF